MKKMAGQAQRAGMDDALLKRQIALINSMTKMERANPHILQASRKKRVARGAGLEVPDVNKLLKMHRQMADAMKKLGKSGMLKGGLDQLLGKDSSPTDAEMAQPGMSDQLTPEKMRELTSHFPGLGTPAASARLRGFGKKR